MPQVFMPPPLRPLVGGSEVVSASGATVREVIQDVDRQYPGVQERLCQDDHLRPGLAVVVDGAVAALGLRQAVHPQAEIHFLPAIGGG